MMKIKLYSLVGLLSTFVFGINAIDYSVYSGGKNDEEQRNLFHVLSSICNEGFSSIESDQKDGMGQLLREGRDIVKNDPALLAKLLTKKDKYGETPKMIAARMLKKYKKSVGCEMMIKDLERLENLSKS